MTSNAPDQVANVVADARGAARDGADAEARADGRLARLVDRAGAWASRAMRTRRGFALVFLVVFALAWVPVIGCVLASGKSFFWQVDGLYQQYVWFVYTGQWLRELASNVFVTHTFEVPMWTMDNGYGVGVLQSFASTFVNPFYFVSAIVPLRFAEYAAELMMLLNIYCAGLAFAWWVVRNGAARSHALIGAVCYVFAGNVLIMFSQPSFLPDILVFPLLLLAADKVFDHESPAMFLVVMGWSFLSSFYDAYMMCILLALYCLVRFFAVVDKGRGAHGRALRLLGWVGAFVGLVLVALLMSCILLLPQVASLLSDQRLDVARDQSLLYEPYYYQWFITGFITYAYMGADSYTGFNAVAPIALVLLACRWRRHKGLFFGFLALTAMMLLPTFGRVMNGFQYPADRWSWAYSLWVAFVIVRMLPEVIAMSARERRVVAGCVIAYGVVVTLLPLPGRSVTFYMAYAVLLLMLALVLCARNWRRERLLMALGCLVAVSGVLTFYLCLSPYFGSKASTLMGVGKSDQFHVTGNAAALIDQAAQDGGYDDAYRVDRPSIDGVGIHNSNLITGHMAPDFYNSIYNQSIDDFYTSLGIVDNEGLNFRYGALNSRSMLDALLGVKYYYVYDNERLLAPYQFDTTSPIATGAMTWGNASLYETDEVAPLAFVSDDYITRGEYLALPMIDRQNALLQTIVLDDDAEGASLQDASDEIVTNSQALDVKVTPGDGVEASDGSFLVRRDGATVTLTFDSVADAETYLSVTGLTYHDIPTRARYTDAEWSALGFIQRMRTRIAEPFRLQCTNGTVSVLNAQGTVTGTIYQLNEKDHLYGDKHDWLCNAGYSKDGTTTITLRFNQAGEYAFDSLGVYAQPMDGFSQEVDDLKAAAATDISIGTNRLSCTATSDTDAQVFWSVAHSDGWSATVDGEPAEVHLADLGFMSVDIPAGTHEVVLTYHTPHLRKAAILSAIGVALAVATCLALRRRRRKTVPRRALPRW
ncbi:YfhO family protein [bacterium]|nr:YfhO family protein [bacterium]